MGDQGVVRRQYWLWVTRPEFYAEEDGSDRVDLDPSTEADVGGWWTCHGETREGDFVLLYRTLPRSDIAYLIQAASDAYYIGDDPFAHQHAWDYGCDYQVLHKIQPPVTLAQLRAHSRLWEWSPLRQNFQRRAFLIAEEDWRRVAELAARDDSRFAAVCGANEGLSISPRSMSEERLEETLVGDLSLLKPFGYDVRLWAHPETGVTGRQYVCRGSGGRIDLLCYEQLSDRFVVIELKSVRANMNTFGQIASYVGFVKSNLANGREVVGLVVSRGTDARFADACAGFDRIRQINVEDLGIDLSQLH